PLFAGGESRTRSRRLRTLLGRRGRQETPGAARGRGALPGGPWSRSASTAATCRASTAWVKTKRVGVRRPALVRPDPVSVLQRSLAASASASPAVHGSLLRLCASICGWGCGMDGLDQFEDCRNVLAVFADIEVSDESGPTGLVEGAEAGAVVAVEILVE